MLPLLWRSGNLLLLGFRALARNKLRTFLTTLGLVIGVGCVIVVIAIGKGAAHQVEATINSLGTNYMFIVPGATQRNGMRVQTESTFTVEDVDAQSAPNVPRSPTRRQ
jgi:putative ABC transport system permease protein